MTGALMAMSFVQAAELTRGLSTQMLHAEQALVRASLRNVFDPVRKALSVNLHRFQVGNVSVEDTDDLRRLLLPAMREVESVGSMMVGDEAGYQWLLMRYDDAVVRSPLLAEQVDLPPVLPATPRYFTREFHRVPDLVDEVRGTHQPMVATELDSPFEFQRKRNLGPNPFQAYVSV
ncbi:MAG: hypothetical protein HC809_10355, partial [Gammaproteobacteria bacterium]|nr:hypothetical protein [Gammaproteobacteria bacterium]